MNIGKGIKFVRVAAGLRQGDMAKMLDISQNYLSLLENNKAEPSIALVKKISNTFGIPPGFIFWEEARPDEQENPEINEKYEQIKGLVHELQRLRIFQRFPQQSE